MTRSFGAQAGRNKRSTPTPIVAAAGSSSQSIASTVTIIGGLCDSLTDGDTQGCSFSGNINTNTNGNSSYLLAENAYNLDFNPDIDLNPLFTVDASQFVVGGSEFVDNVNGTYTFNLDNDIMLEFFAVKGGNGFTLFEYIGGSDNTYTFASNNLSHVTFFGSQGMGGGIPEPGVWAMMLIGFGALGSQVRRRRINLKWQMA